MSITQRYPGAIAGAAFGLVFVLANAHAPLGRDAALVVRLAALDGVATLILLSIVSRGPAGAVRRPARWFGHSLWEVAAAELAFLVVAVQVLRAFGAPAEANVAMLALVVGLHFVGLGIVREQPSIALAGGFVFVLAIAGLVVTATAASDWVPFVSGVLPGLTLLAGSLFAILQTRR
jgi:hypothetical protein